MFLILYIVTLVSSLFLTSCVSLSSSAKNSNDGRDYAVPLHVSKDQSDDVYKKSIDKQITISGVAKNARLGAVVIANDNVPFYIDGVTEWKTPILDKIILVTGLLRRKSLAPKAGINSSGEVSHGVGGESYIIENPKWKIVDDTRSP